MEDLHKIGGIPALLKYLLNHTNLIDGSQMTVTGKTLAQNLEDVEELDKQALQASTRGAATTEPDAERYMPSITQDRQWVLSELDLGAHTPCTYLINC